MKNKILNEIEQAVSAYCWENLPGDETWSNNFYNCALIGAEINKKETEKVLRDVLNKHKSQLQQETTPKLDKTPNFEKEVSYRAYIEIIEELQNKLKNI